MREIIMKTNSDLELVYKKIKGDIPTLGWGLAQYEDMEILTELVSGNAWVKNKGETEWKECEQVGSGFTSANKM